MLVADWQPISQEGDGNGGLIVCAILLGIVVYGYFKMKG